MKLPERPPDRLQAHYEDIRTSLLTFEMRDTFEAANSEYLYWSEFKHKPMPKGVKPEQAWAALKRFTRRSGIKTIILSSKVDFCTYWLPPSALEHLHHIDRNAGGMWPSGALDDLRAERDQFLINSLMEEAIASSQIEGAVTTRAVAKEMLRSGRKPRDHAERMIYNNYLTMQKIKERINEPLGINLLNELHAEITKGTLEDESWSGKLRTEQNEIHDPENRVVLYTPPHHTQVHSTMLRLCDFANNKEGRHQFSKEFIHPVIKGIALHFWFAWVHPYMDGNGRMARALFYWYMLREGYWVFEYLPISRAIMNMRIQYYKAFLYTELDENDLTYFIMFNLRAIDDAAREVRAYIERKEREKRAAMAFLTKYPTLNLRQRALLASALEKPDEHFTIEGHARVHGVVYQSSRTDLQGLERLGLLEMFKAGRKMIYRPVRDLSEKLKAPR